MVHFETEDGSISVYLQLPFISKQTVNQGLFIIMIYFEGGANYDLFLIMAYFEAEANKGLFVIVSHFETEVN